MSLNERFGQPKPLRAVPDPDKLAASIAAHPAGQARGQKWAEAKLVAQADALMLMQPNTGRNDALNSIAYSCGKLIPGGWLDEQHVIDVLHHAGTVAGLEQDEMIGFNGQSGTIHSGINAGKREPRDPPITLDDPQTQAATPPQQPPPPGVNLHTGEIEPERQPDPLPRLDLNRLALRLPPPEWLVEGRITARTLVVLGSKPGIGKSWTASALAVALTAGQDWLGHPISTPKRVLYIDVENGEDLGTRRLQQLGATPESVGDRLYYTTEAVMFPGGKDSQRYADTLALHKPDLVILDTLASAAPSAEKGTEEASLLLSDVWHRARAAGAACLILAHTRKSQQGASKDDPLDSLRGAGHLGGAASSVWILEPRGNRRFALRAAKTREDFDQPTLRVLLTDIDADPSAVVDKWTRLEIDGIEEDETVETPFLRYQARVLELIDSHPTGVATTAALLTLGDGEVDKTLRNYLHEMKKAGVVESAGRGHYKRPGQRL